AFPAAKKRRWWGPRNRSGLPDDRRSKPRRSHNTGVKQIPSSLVPAEIHWPPGIGAVPQNDESLATRRSGTMHNLKGKVAVVTGGNSGIGKATARLFAERGAQVVITGRRRDAVQTAAAEIGYGVIGLTGDVAELDHHARLVEEIRRRFGGFDIFVANA